MLMLIETENARVVSSVPARAVVVDPASTAAVSEKARAVAKTSRRYSAHWTSVSRKRQVLRYRRSLNGVCFYPVQ